MLGHWGLEAASASSLRAAAASPAASKASRGVGWGGGAGGHSKTSHGTPWVRAGAHGCGERVAQILLRGAGRTSGPSQPCRRPASPPGPGRALERGSGRPAEREVAALSLRRWCAGGAPWVQTRRGVGRVAPGRGAATWQKYSRLGQKELLGDSGRTWARQESLGGARRAGPPLSGSTVVRPRCLGPQDTLRRRSVGRAGASSGVGECTKTSVRALKPEDMCHCARPSTMTGPVVRPHGPARSPSQAAAAAGPGHRLGQDGGYAAC